MQLHRIVICAFAFALACAAPAPASAQYWGAIAVDHQSGDMGWSYRWRSEQQARNVAVGECKKQGRGNVCDQIYSFQNSCTALVENNTGPEKDHARYVGAGANESTATLDAMAKCQADGRPGCEFSVSLCSWSNKATE